MTCAPNRAISSACGLNCSSISPTPACSYARIRSATCSGVPTSPARSPRLDTLYSRSDSSDSSCEPFTKSWYDAYASGLDRTSSDPVQLRLRLRLGVPHDDVAGHAEAQRRPAGLLAQLGDPPDPVGDDLGRVAVHDVRVAVLGDHPHARGDSPPM